MITRPNKQLMIWCIDYALKEFMIEHSIADFGQITSHAKKIYDTIGALWYNPDHEAKELVDFVKKHHDIDVEALWGIMEKFGVDRKFMLNEGRKAGQDSLYLAMYRLSIRKLEPPLEKSVCYEYPITPSDSTL